MISKKKGFKTTRIWDRLSSVVLVAVLIIFLFPIVWIFLSSFKKPIDLFSENIKIFFQPTLQNYKRVLLTKDINKYIINSLIIASLTTVIVISVGSLAAYSLARFKFRGTRNIEFWILSQRMFPPIVTAIPFFLVMRTFRLLDTYLAVILAYTTFNLPLAVWMLREFFSEIPEEMEEQAMVDGCSRLSTFFRITLPLATPGLASAAILCFIFSWNEFLFALILTNTSKSQTLPVAIAGFLGYHKIEWGSAFAMGCIASTPLLALAFFIQKRIISGLTFGAVKK